ncbi:MAG: hypothetical protein P9X24_04515 [Candidatus Hatepunaea meridiana]|nr:hypothetical protein [Candidatus Hatepunaea meridiana]
MNVVSKKIIILIGILLIAYSLWTFHIAYYDMNMDLGVKALTGGGLYNAHGERVHNSAARKMGLCTITFIGGITLIVIGSLIGRKKDSEAIDSSPPDRN